MNTRKLLTYLILGFAYYLMLVGALFTGIMLNLWVF